MIAASGEVTFSPQAAQTYSGSPWVAVRSRYTIFHCTIRTQRHTAPKLLLTDKKIKTVGAGRGLNDFLQLSQHTKDLLNIFYCLKFDIIGTAILELDIRTILKYFLHSRYIF